MLFWFKFILDTLDTMTNISTGEILRHIRCNGDVKGKAFILRRIFVLVGDPYMLIKHVLKYSANVRRIGVTLMVRNDNAYLSYTIQKYLHP